jgi:serine/threonine protein kinase
MDTLALKNYRIIKQVGQGGMGVVYLAEDLSLGRMVALKFLAPYLVQDPEILKRFRAEARSQARLLHPNITLVYAFEEVGDQAFLVLEYLRGETLEHRIKEQGRLPAKESMTVLGKVLAAVDYAHGRGVIHRDIKPVNIGFTPEGTVKLMDFGIALNLTENDRLTRTGHILGTPHYMAPEQILGQPVMVYTDIYALGITLYEMLAGKVPFGGGSDYAVSVAQINDPPPPLLSLGYEDITRELEAVVFKALAKPPQERFQTARDFRLALEAATAGLPNPSLRTGPAHDQATQALNLLGREANSAPEPLHTGSLPPPSKARYWQGVKLLTAAGTVLLLATLGWLMDPFGMSKRFLPTSPTPGKSSQAHQSPPVADKKMKVVASPTPPGQPEGTKIMAVKEGKEVGAGLDPASSDPVKGAQVRPPTMNLAATPLTPPPIMPDSSKKREKSPMDYLGPMKTKLKEQGFSGIQTSLDEKGWLIISGQVKRDAQRDEVMSIVKSANFPGPVNFDQLTVAKRVVEKPVRKTMVRESREPREIPAPPPPVMAPMKPLGPKLD